MNVTVEQLQLRGQQDQALIAWLAAEWARERAGRLRAESALLRDPMTGGLNRVGFDLAARTEAIRDRFAEPVLAIFDADKFKLINAELGYAAGDEVIKAIAVHLRTVFGDDVTARLGGDEFITLTDASRLAPIGFPVIVPTDDGPALLQVQLSGGYTPFQLDGFACDTVFAADLKVVKAQADAALRRVKATGRGAVAEYHPRRDDHAAPQRGRRPKVRNRDQGQLQIEEVAAR